MAFTILSDGCDRRFLFVVPTIERYIFLRCQRSSPRNQLVGATSIDNRADDMTVVGENGNMVTGILQGKATIAQGSGGKCTRTLSHEPRTIPQPFLRLARHPATYHGRNDGTWKHEMINGSAMERRK